MLLLLHHKILKRHQNQHGNRTYIPTIKITHAKTQKKAKKNKTKKHYTINVIIPKVEIKHTKSAPSISPRQRRTKKLKTHHLYHHGHDHKCQSATPRPPKLSTSTPPHFFFHFPAYSIFFCRFSSYSPRSPSLLPTPRSRCKYSLQYIRSMVKVSI